VLTLIFKSSIIYVSGVERRVFFMKELYEKPIIDEIIFDTKAVMSGEFISDPYGIEDGEENDEE